MKKHNQSSSQHSALDEYIIEMLAETQQPAPIPLDLATRMRGDLLQKIKSVEASKQPGFSTMLAKEGEWIEAFPGAQFKVLHDDGKGLDGLLSYLIKLEPGVEMDGHDHPFDEECLMLEGDLTLGDITLNKGDFHYASTGVRHGHLSTKNGCMAFIRGALPV